MTTVVLPTDGSSHSLAAATRLFSPGLLAGSLAAVIAPLRAAFIVMGSHGRRVLLAAAMDSLASHVSAAAAVATPLFPVDAGIS